MGADPGSLDQQLLISLNHREVLNQLGFRGPLNTLSSIAQK
jgi:hypothetical protein